ncbi:MAG: hypothetical protein JWM19_6646 [Actinomycetia bacterium]|nr:hypothetical protein [Actinomycetes bacterium]
MPGRRPYRPLVDQRRGQLPERLLAIVPVGDDGPQQPGVILGLAEGLLQLRPRDLVETLKDLVGGHRLALHPSRITFRQQHPLARLRVSAA